LGPRSSTGAPRPLASNPSLVTDLLRNRHYAYLKNGGTLEKSRRRLEYTTLIRLHFDVPLMQCN
jgi:hypothetical protein